MVGVAGEDAALPRHGRMAGRLCSGVAVNPERVKKQLTGCNFRAYDDNVTDGNDEMGEMCRGRQYETYGI